MCIANLFKRKPAIDPNLTLPHPEETKDETQTAANTDLNAMLEKWLTDWYVPAEYWDFWKTRIQITVYDSWPPECLASGIKVDTPAYTIDESGGRHLYILASWLNPGVIAHEQAHNSYALLTAAEKSRFAAAYHRIKNSDPLIKLLYSKNTYGLTNDVEGHAEIFRYICEELPPDLKQYYPKLF